MFIVKTEEINKTKGTKYIVMHKITYWKTKNKKEYKENKNRVEEGGSWERFTSPPHIT